MKEYRSVAFRGLENLSKYELIEGVPVKTTGEKVVVDMTSFQKRLKAMALVRDYRLYEEKGALVVEVTEAVPFLQLAVKDRKETLFLLLGEDLKVLGRNRFFFGRRPVVFCDRDDLSGSRFSSRLSRLLVIMKNVRREQKVLFREIRSIRQKGATSLIVKLHGRKTRFHLAADETGFARLRAVAGYCDANKKYPERVAVKGNKIVLR